MDAVAAPTGPPHLTYPGDVVGAVLGQIMGPTHIAGGSRAGEWLVATTATYDPDTDRTRVGFRYVPPAMMAEAILVDGLIRLPGRRQDAEVARATP